MNDWILSQTYSSRWHLQRTRPSRVVNSEVIAHICEPLFRKIRTFRYSPVLSCIRTDVVPNNTVLIMLEVPEKLFCTSSPSIWLCKLSIVEHELDVDLWFVVEYVTSNDVADYKLYICTWTDNRKQYEMDLNIKNIICEKRQIRDAE